MVNVDLAERVIAHIRTLPTANAMQASELALEDTYDMRTYGIPNAGEACGTSACLAGWALSIAYPEDYRRYINRSGLTNLTDLGGLIDGYMIEAQRILGLTYEQADAMFHAYTATADDHARVFKLLAEDPDMSGLDVADAYYEGGVVVNDAYCLL